MNLTAVCTELAVQLDTIAGLRVHLGPPGAVVPPAAVFLNPAPGDITYDATYGRGMDRMILPVVVLIARSTERGATEQVRPYLDGSGAQSVKAVLEAGEYETLHTVRVAEGGVDGVKWAGTDYLAALFNIHISGQGG